MDLPTPQALTAANVEDAMFAIANLDMYGYKATPTIRANLQDVTNEEVKEGCRVVLRKSGWLPPATS